VKHLRIAGLLVLGMGCGDGSLLTVGRTLDVCETNLPPACGAAPRCVLTDSTYISGQFPGGRAFVAQTTGPAKLTIDILLSDEKTAGTELLVKVHEANCSDVYTWDSDGRDLFRLADQDGVLEIPIAVQSAGDHPIEIIADAYCDYDLVVQVDESAQAQ
jgi:hypothetical protein